ncbi:AMP-binding protein [Demequina sp. NBRC 110055]|uniref:AMP-binding protein n=1 Tax=Demequina sp. NBRC 110055 TaxID=1570344 RepID=UPI0009FDFE0B|nr:AMP-binding protein [Demequina sp. NBRC 110055]
MNYAPLVEGPEAAVAAALDRHTDGIAARTSGSTGEPREVWVSGAAMRASSAATLDRLGGPGHWLLAMPTDRIAGAMVLARARMADASVTTLATGPFTAAAFAAATAAMPHGRRYVSLVPTQLRRVIADPAGADALASFDAVLIGGAPPGMALPANAVETYGMTETSGGCVYDGRPLDDVAVRIAADGRIEIAGPTLADGYRDGDNSAFLTDDAARWFRTSDLGAWDGERLVVHGRADHVIITGGHNVHPAAVERAMADAGVAHAIVVGLPDPEWGERIIAVVHDDAPSIAAVRATLDLPRHALPRALVRVTQIPRTEAGKIDRSAARALAAASDLEETS